MKKNIIYLLLTAYVILGCERIHDDIKNGANGPVPEFYISLDIQTKNTNDGIRTFWAFDDKINVFHAESGTENFVNDGAFEYVSENSFKGILSENLSSEKSYDWYVAYPYDSLMTSPKLMKINIPVEQLQSEDGSMEHLKGGLCPLVGTTKNLSSGSPVSIRMNHLVTIMQIKVTNYEANICELQTVSFRADENPDGLAFHQNENVSLSGTDTQIISGEFLVDFTGSTIHYIQNGSTCSSRPVVRLNSAKSLSLNESATVFLVCLPFHVNNATPITIGMNNVSGGITQRIYGRNVSCKAGEICSIKQGSRLAPPFKNGINFYHGKKNADGTYTYEENWWRCDLPADFQLSGEFDFADLFTTCNTGDAYFTLIGSDNQNDKVQNNYQQLSACLVTADNGKSRIWRRNARWETNFNVDYNDKSGIFVASYAGYGVGSGEWNIFYRVNDPFSALIDGEYLQYAAINGGALWGNNFDAPCAAYGTITAGSEIDICPFWNARPGAFGDHAANLNLFLNGWIGFSLKSSDGKELIVNDGHIHLTEYAERYCQFSSGIKWIPGWFKYWNGTSYEETAWDGGAGAANYGISITDDGKLVTSSNYTGVGFQLAPSMTFQYDYGYAQHIGAKYLPFIVCNI